VLLVSFVVSIPCRNGAPESFHRSGHPSAITKNRRPGDEHAGSRIDHQRRSRRVDTAIDLQIAAALDLSDHLVDAANLWQHRVDEMLVSKARVDSHD